MLPCTTLRAGILVSALLLVSGFLIEVLTTYGLLPTVSGSYLGFFLAVAAVLILAGLFVLSLIPAVARRLAECER
jgi:putative copper export protein